MSLTKNDLLEIQKIVSSAVTASEERTAKKIDSAVTASEERVLSKLEQKIDELTLLTGQGFNETSEKIELLDDKIENLKRIVEAEVKRNDRHETTITKIRKQLRAV